MWDIEWCDYWPENARVPRINPYSHHKDVYMVEGDKVWYGHPNASWVGFWHLDPKTGNVTKVD
jgi:streptogramin lyase